MTTEDVPTIEGVAPQATIVDEKVEIPTKESKPKPKSKTAQNRERTKTKLSKKYNNYLAKLNAKERPTGTREEAAQEALERMKYMEMDDLYKERTFQNTMVSIIESERGSTKYSPQERMKAVMAYMVTASTYQAAEITGIPFDTLRYWKEYSSWWPKALEYARNAKKEALVSKLGEVQDLALRAVKDRLEGGDYKYNPREDKLVRVPVSAKDAMNIAANSQDKGAVLRGEATNITEKRQSQDNLLSQIAAKLEKAIASADAKVIEGVVISSSTTKAKGK